MIPKEIRREHILAAIRELKSKSDYAGRKSRKYYLVHDGEHFPPKLVLSVAAQKATGIYLDPDKFSGGDESNRFLQNLGFKVMTSNSEVATSSSVKREPNKIKSPLKQSEKHYKIGRVVIDGEWSGDQSDAAELINYLIESWPKNITLDYMITSGGFITQEREINKGIESNDEMLFKFLQRIALESKSAFLTPRLKKQLKMICKVLSFGVDTWCETETDTRKVEFVFVYSTVTDSTVITGKSYPTMSQESYLIPFLNLDSHFMKLQNEKVMVLGCHDLSMFEGRTQANVKSGGWRKDLINRFIARAKEFQPTIVLQHPHTNDHHGTWQNKWYGLLRLLPTVKEFAGSGTYFNSPEEPCRDPIEKCLGYSASDDVLNIVVSLKNKFNVSFSENTSQLKRSRS